VELEVKTGRETAMRPRLLRSCLVALAVASGVLLAGCDDADETGGVGAAATLPAPFLSNTTNPTDIGVDNVHWVGNPRW
jgi:hypothetical protein